MNSRQVIGIVILSLHICLTHQKAFWNGKFIYPEGLFLDNNGRVLNMYDNPLSNNGNVDITPFMLVTDSSFQQMNTAKYPPSGPISVVNKGTHDLQPIFKLFEHTKPTKTDVNSNGGISTTASTSNIQHIPEMFQPTYNTYYEKNPGFYEIQNPQFNSNYDTIEIPDQKIFPSQPNYFMDPSFFQQNINYRNPSSMVSTDASSVDDETYKVTLKSASNIKSLPIMDLGPVRGFKTNFSGDSKCDMICKCRYVHLKEPDLTPTPSEPFTPRKLSI